MAVALVTAASQGIGAAIARGLHARGWQLALMSRSERISAIATELDAVAVRGSVTLDADLSRLVDAAVERWGHIDAVVNNTGHPAKGDPLTLSDAQWQDGYDLVLGSVIRLARLAVPHMTHGASIVTVSSGVDAPHGRATRGQWDTGQRRAAGLRRQAASRGEYPTGQTGEI